MMGDHREQVGRIVMMKRRAPAPVRVGLFGIGLQAYWTQFPGLKTRLEGYQREVEAGLAAVGASVISGGLVDTPLMARAVGERFTEAAVDLVICYVGTYATSSQVLPVVGRGERPVLVLNLQPVPELDYERTDTGEWLANCCACCVPELAGAFARCGIPFNLVSGLLRPEDGPAGTDAWERIGDWIAAAGAVTSLRRGRLGILGHTYPGMLDLYSDPTMLTASTGLHVEILEMDDLQARVDAAVDGHVQERLETARSMFAIDDGSPADPAARVPYPDDLAWAARVAVGLDALQRDFALDALSYYYRGLNGNASEQLVAGLIIGATLLTTHGVPCAGEGDAKTAIAMLIMDRLGAGGSFTEFYAMDFVNDFLLMGHDGPCHLDIMEGKAALRGLSVYHGKRGSGVSVEARVRTGPVTILTLTQTAAGQLKLLMAEGESLPGPVLGIANTNSRIRFDCAPAEFIDQWCAHGPTHHCALGVGHQTERIAKVGRLLKLETVVVGGASR